VHVCTCGTSTDKYALILKESIFMNPSLKFASKSAAKATLFTALLVICVSSYASLLAKEPKQSAASSTSPQTEQPKMELKATPVPVTTAGTLKAAQKPAPVATMPSKDGSGTLQATPPGQAVKN